MVAGRSGKVNLNLMKWAVEGEGTGGVVDSRAAGLVAAQPLHIEEISYQDLLRYEPLYDRERMPLRFVVATVT